MRKCPDDDFLFSSNDKLPVDRSIPARMRCHLFLWILSFLLWYILFAAAFCAHIFPYSTKALIVQLILFQIIWVLAVFSLFSTTLTTPAEIPERFVPPKEIFGKRNLVEAIADWATAEKLPVRYVSMSTEDGNIKCPPFCLYCKVIKPNRTHHCRKCARCIIRMDHHCPIIGRCVHMHNHKFFLLFLFWATILCTYAVFTTAPALFRRTPIVIWSFTGMFAAVMPGHMPRAPPPTDGLVATCLVASGALNALICGVSLSVFLGQLTNLLLRNETTLESTSIQLCGSNDGRHAAGNMCYNLGSRWANFRSIFGPNPLLWLLPVSTTYGDGFFKDARPRTVQKKEANKKAVENK